MTADLASWRAHRSGVSAVDELVGALAVEQLSATAFAGHSTSVPRHRVFGGQLLAQCVVAATLTVSPGVAPGAALHSLHAYFVRAARPQVRLDLEVTALRDGRSFALRRVEIRQDGELVTSVTASFHLAEDGIAHQDPMPDRGSPADLPARTPFPAAPGGPATAGAVDLRACPPRPGLAESSVWLRVGAPLPDDPVLHRALLVYLSDLSILHGAFHLHAVARQDVHTASLDHSMWLHRPARADDWLLHESRSPSSAGARAMGQAALFTASGGLAATAAQEMLVRRRV